MNWWKQRFPTQFIQSMAIAGVHMQEPHPHVQQIHNLWKTTYHMSWNYEVWLSACMDSNNFTDDSMSEHVINRAVNNPAAMEQS